MKKILYILPLVLLTMVFFTCRKDSTGPSNTLIGRWKFVSAVGGYTGKQVVLATGKDIYTFKQDSTFVITHNDTLKSQGSFHIVPEKSIFTGTLAPILKFNNGSTGSVIGLKTDSLTLTDNHVEPFSSLFVRVK